MKTLKIIAAVISVVIGVYFIYAIIMPLAFISGEVFWYKINIWGCNKKGGDYITVVKRDKLGNEYTYQKCSFKFN